MKFCNFLHFQYSFSSIAVPAKRIQVRLENICGIYIGGIQIIFHLSLETRDLPHMGYIRVVFKAF